MKTRMKALAALVLGLCTLLAGAGVGQAAMKCERNTITLVVPFAAGGGTDRWGRILSSAAYDAFDMGMRVRNMPGASALVGWKWVLSQKPDGCTLLLASPTPVIAILREKNPPIQPSQIKITSAVSSFRSILLAAPGKSWSTLDGLKAEAKKDPGKLTVGGTQSHVLGQTFILNQIGVKFTAVPYASTGKAISDFLGGHIDMVAITASSGRGLIPRKALPLLNSSNMPIDSKMKEYKGLPTAKDLGVKPMSFLRWVGVHPDTPDPIVDEISANMGKLLKEKSIKRLIAKINEEIIYMPRAQAEKEYNEMVENMKSAVALLKK